METTTSTTEIPSYIYVHDKNKTLEEPPRDILRIVVVELPSFVTISSTYWYTCNSTIVAIRPPPPGYARAPLTTASIKALPAISAMLPLLVVVVVVMLKAALDESPSTAPASSEALSSSASSSSSFT